MLETIVKMHSEGLSYKEISERTGKSRGTIVGMLVRYKERGGPPTPRNVVDIAQIESAISEHGGDVTKAANALGLHPSTLRSRGYLTGRKQTNRATDPDTRAVVALMVASGKDLLEISAGSGVSERTLGNWRGGRHKGQTFLLQCVREYLTKNTPGY